ncbi:aldo/keto reductase [Arthrobacter sp. efr-133-TYG-118]|uniref:aldo/keto reductase n=1 Tax=Arthrobacter sp. efr-133-TYG-118 TaxID=3040279 RepID=UPI00255048F1|nr:aldo/keto reductase [Arthrobacter sp. efr-133-TYG-118]
MEYTRLGSSGLKVSRISMGTMGYGDGSREIWAIDYDAAAPFFRQALDLGITFWDTANIYSFGGSEKIVGRAIKELTRRDDIVLATKVHQHMHEGSGGSGLSRKAVMEQADASLTRLGTDYIDLYQIHRYDPETPVEETMEALHDVVKAGKARYLGASSMFAWQFAKMQHAAEAHGFTKFVSMQNQYSPIMREEEREMFPLLADQGVGSNPWSPLAGGFVARPWGEKNTDRAKTNADVDFNGNPLWLDSDRDIVDAIERIAQARGVSKAQIVLAWVLKNPVVNAPIVGTTKEHHLADATAALDLDLTDDEITAIEKPYARREPTWF